jgi:hypothetical protein
LPDAATAYSKAALHNPTFSKKEFKMSDAITAFNVQMQTQMRAVQNSIEALNAKGMANAELADKEIRSQIRALEESGHKAKASLDAARAEVTKWADDPVATVAGWKTKFDVSMLGARADRADKYALAASQVAAASVEAAQKAALDAKLARSEADTAKTAKAA